MTKELLELSLDPPALGCPEQCCDPTSPSLATVTAVLPLHYVTGDLNPNKLLL